MINKVKLSVMDKNEFINDGKNTSNSDVNVTDQENNTHSKVEMNNTPNNDECDDNENVIHDLNQTKLQDKKFSSSKFNDNNDKKLDELSKELMDFLKDQSKSFSISAIPIRHKAESQNANQNSKPNSKQKSKQLSFNYTPQEVKQHLDRFVIKQDDAKKTLAIALCDHFNMIKLVQKGEYDGHYSKQNVLLSGPTGVGKTFLIKCLADLVGVPFIKSDATKFTETGYVGSDVEDMIRQLYNKANQDINLAQYGIIYIDEIDKIAGSQHQLGKDVGGRGVQSNLLKLLEDTEVPLKAPWDIQSHLKGLLNQGDDNQPETLNTKHILFVVSGAFQGLDDIVRKRVEGSRYGFERDMRDRSADQLFSQASTEDYIKFGFEPEFIGRLPVRTACESLDEEDFFSILKESETSLVHQYVAAFKGYEIDLKIEDCALHFLAKEAVKEKTGARGLSTVFERYFREFKYRCPSLKLSSLIITEPHLQDPEWAFSELEKLPVEQLEISYVNS